MYRQCRFLAEAASFRKVPAANSYMVSHSVKRAVMCISAFRTKPSCGNSVRPSATPGLLSTDRVEVYPGMIVGKHVRDTDLDVNVCKIKQLSNMRSSTRTSPSG